MYGAAAVCPKHTELMRGEQQTLIIVSKMAPGVCDWQQC